MTAHATLEEIIIQNFYYNSIFVLKTINKNDVTTSQRQVLQLAKMTQDPTKIQLSLELSMHHAQQQSCMKGAVL